MSDHFIDGEHGWLTFCNRIKFEARKLAEAEAIDELRRQAENDLLDALDNALDHAA